MPPKKEIALAPSSSSSSSSSQQTTLTVETSVPQPYLQSAAFDDLIKFELSLEQFKKIHPDVKLQPMTTLVDPTVQEVVLALTDASEFPTDIPAANKLLTQAFKPQSSPEIYSFLHKAKIVPIPGSDNIASLIPHLAFFKKVITALGVNEKLQPKFFLDSLSPLSALHPRLHLEIGLLHKPSITDVYALAIKTARKLDAALKEFDILPESFIAIQQISSQPQSRRPLIVIQPSPESTQSPQSPQSTPSPQSLPSLPVSTQAPRPVLQKLSEDERARCLANRTCFRCRQPGHNAKDCPLRGTTTSSPSSSSSSSSAPVRSVRDPMCDDVLDRDFAPPMAPAQVLFPDSPNSGPRAINIAVDTGSALDFSPREFFAANDIPLRPLPERQVVLASGQPLSLREGAFA
jgi:hypothetical protein